MDRILLAHGGGGQLTAELVEQVVLPALGGPQNPKGLTDAAVLSLQGPLAFTTDSYVVQPLEFPGGDIGKLAICGTVNDLAVSGAAPKVISLALILQEGLEIALLRRVLASAGLAARQAGVSVVTGDTKVVERGGGEGGGLFINTAGIGVLLSGAQLGFDRLRQGDQVILSGALGEHGLAVMSLRKGLSFTADLASDCAALHELSAALIGELGEAVRFMRDPTRGGLAATLADLAAASGHDIMVRESSIPLNRTARAAAEMLGLDLLNVANEGKLVAVVAAEAAGRAVAILSGFAIAREAAVIGEIGPRAENALVELETALGGRRIVQMPYGEDLPRIC